MLTIGSWKGEGLPPVPRDCSSPAMVRISQLQLIMWLTTQDTDDVDLDDDDDEEEFHYPGASPTTTARPPSLRSTTTDYFGRSFGSGSRAPTDLTPHLSQAPEFRVPTHEAPQKVLTPRWAPPTPHSLHATWERDDAVSECRECHRRFSFLNRRVSSIYL